MHGIYWALNKVFGKTQVFIFILAWFLVITGFFMLWKPGFARRSMARKGFRIIKAYLLFLVLLLGAFLVSVANRMSGILALVILVAGVVMLVKGFVFFQRAAAAKLDSWAGNLPEKYVRAYAVIQVAIGIGMHILQRRMIGY